MVTGDDGRRLAPRLASFIGREQEVAEVRRLLSTTRLLTLTGGGGIGKTRLALQVGRDWTEAFADGLWLVELASLAEPTLVPQAVSSELGLREKRNRPLLGTLSDFLRSKQGLLILDHCEHLLDACAALADTLRRTCPHLSILATSRQALGSPDETTRRVPSLSLSDPQHPSSVGAAGAAGNIEHPLRGEAVRLFVDRARTALPTFAVTERNAAAVTHVCRRLRGVPLAIELAAAWVKLLSVEEIARRLDDGFRLSTAGGRDPSPWHRAVQVAMDWSYDLLSEPERMLLRRLSVFAGGWTLEGAEAIYGGKDVEGYEVAGVLAHLLDRSLVFADDRVGGPVAGLGLEARYRLHETVREYSQVRLLEAGEADSTRERHRDYFAGLAESTMAPAAGYEAWFGRLRQEQDDLRVALAWSQTHPSGAEVGLRLAGALADFWTWHGYLSEGRHWLARTLGQGAGRPSLDPLSTRRARTRALDGTGVLARAQGDYAAADSFFEESLASWRELGDRWGIARALHNLGSAAQDRGDFGRATVLLEESLAIWRECGDRSGMAAALGLLGIAAESQNDSDGAAALLEHSLALYRCLDDARGIAWALGNLGRVAQAQGEYERAATLLGDSLALGRDLGDGVCIAECLEGLAAVAGVQAQPEQAARLFGAAEALRETIGAPRSPAQGARHERDLTAARAGLGEEALAAAWADGWVIPLEQVIAYALEAATSA